MVLGVCRRILCDTHDAEDAFQATFFVLARKAATVAPREMLAGWLFGVPRRTAIKARASIQRRRSQERQVTEIPDRETPRPGGMPDDSWPILDEELCRLPPRYQAPMLLCDVQAMSRRQAAETLGWTEGTVCGRLARARAIMRTRLARRGVGLSGSALAVAWVSRQAEAALCGKLVSTTVVAACPLAAGKAVSPRLISPGVSFTYGRSDPRVYASQ